MSKSVLYPNHFITSGSLPNKKRIRATVYIDAHELAVLIARAAKNKSGKSRDGALSVEVRSIETAVQA